MQSFDTTNVRPDLPDIDDRLVEPETGYEMYDGELVRVSPADPPHAERQVKLGALVVAHLDPAFRGADRHRDHLRLDEEPLGRAAARMTESAPVFSALARSIEAS